MYGRHQDGMSLKYFNEKKYIEDVNEINDERNIKQNHIKELKLL